MEAATGPIVATAISRAFSSRAGRIAHEVILTTL